MLRINKKIISVFLILPLAILMIFCCCLSKQAHAASLGLAKKAPACHASTPSSKIPSQPGTTCSDCQEKIINLIPVESMNMGVLSVGTWDVVANVKSWLPVVSYRLVSLTRSDPLFSSGQPIYILYRQIRI